MLAVFITEMVILFKHVIITIIIIIIIFDLRKQIRYQIGPEYGKLSSNQKLLNRY